MIFCLSHFPFDSGKKYGRSDICWSLLPNYFAVLLASYWFIGWTLNSCWPIVQLQNNFRTWRAAEKCKNFCRALKYVLLFTEIYWRIDKVIFQTVWESVLQWFGEVSNNNYFSRYVFTLYRGKMANATAHQRKILAIQKSEEVLI